MKIILSKTLTALGAGLVVFYILLLTRGPAAYSITEILTFEIFGGISFFLVVLLFMIFTKFARRFNLWVACVISILGSVIFSSTAALIFSTILIQFPDSVQGGNAIPQILIKQIIAVTQILCLFVVGCELRLRLKERNRACSD